MVIFSIHLSNFYIIQIGEKENMRIRQRQAFFEEGVKLDEEARQRRLKLDDIKRKKLEELR